MGRALVFACLLLFVGAAAAQDEGVGAAWGGGRSSYVGGPALNVISCAVDANGNVAGVGGASCSAGTLTAPIYPTAAITSVVAYRGYKRGAAASTFTRTLARIEFFSSGGVLQGFCGSGAQSGRTRTYTYSKNGATKLASISTARCRGNAVAFNGLRLGWTDGPFTPFPRASPSPLPTPRPPPPPPSSPSPSPIVTNDVESTVVSTYSDLTCTDANIAGVNSAVNSYLLAGLPAGSTVSSVTTCENAGRHLLVVIFRTRSRVITSSFYNAYNLVTLLLNVLRPSFLIVFGQVPTSVNGSVQPLPPTSPSPSPVFSPSPSPSPYGSPRR